MIKKDGPSIRDIAKIAGVSAITVSRAINTPELVKKETRQKISKVLDKLNYQPNLFAKSLRTLKTKNIGVLITTAYEEFQQSLLHGIESALRQNGYKIILGVSNDKVDIENEYIDIFVKNRVEGIILYSINKSGKFIFNVMNNYKIPIVLLDNIFDSFQFNCVLNPNKKGIKLLANHLSRNGNIAFIGGPLKNYVGKMRLTGFKEFLIDKNIKIDNRFIRIGDWDIDSGFLLTEQLLKEKLKFSSILTANYLIAIGALQALDQYNINIPQDIKIATFDDFSFNILLSTPLTTLNNTGRKIGFESARLLLQKIKNNDLYNFERIIIEAKLIKRKSTE